MRETSRAVDKKLQVNNNQDQSVYDAEVKMSQDFSMRYPLINGQGNYGNLDGDGAAAMRYTEAKLSVYGNTMLNDLKKNTVDFVPNFDGEEIEPTVLSTLLPNILANGTSGIAVGMATNMPPHNIADVYDCLNYIIDCAIANEDIDEEKLIDIIKAPDFPTKGKIINSANIRECYKEGHGRVVVRGAYEIEDNKIIITEIPYKVNKARLVERIDSLSRSLKKDEQPIISAIKEVRDESSKGEIRIVVELKKDHNPEIVINKLLKYTDLQTTFSVNNTVLVNGEPRVVSLFTILEKFLEHSCEVIIRKSQFELDKALKRINIVEAVLICCSDDNLEAIVNIIRTSDNPIQDLINAGLNKEQAEYISEVKIKTLSKKSEEKMLIEKEQLETAINKYNSILTDDSVLLETVKFEYNLLKEKFKEERKTEIIVDSSVIDEEDLIKDETLIITITDTNLIKSVEEKEYNTQKRGGKGSKITNKDNDNIKYMFTANSKDNLMFFTNLGKVHLLKAYKIIKTNKNSRGKSIFNYIKLDLENEEKIVNVIAASTNDTTKSLLMITKNGVIKRLQLDKLSTRMSVTKIIEFKDHDSLKAVLLIAEEDNIIINTARGMSLATTVEESSIRPMGRTAYGVTGIRFKTKEDYVVDASLCDKEYLLTISKNGMGKRTKLSSFSLQNRGGKGCIAHKITEKTGEVICALTVNDNDDIFISTEQGQLIRIDASSISISSRSTIGVKLVDLNDGDTVANASIMIQSDMDEEV